MIELTKNIAWSSLSFLFRLLSNVVIFVFIARFYGPDKFGQFSYYVLIASLVSLVSDFGVHQRTLKAYSTQESEQAVGKLVTVKFIFLSVSMLPLIIFSLYLDDFNVVFVGVSFLINSFFDFCLIGFRGRGFFKKEAGYAFLNNVTFFCITFIVLTLSDDISLLCVSLILSRIIPLVTFFLKERGEFFSIYSIEIKDLKEHFMFGFDYLLINVWMFLDGFLVRLFYSTYLFGIYSSYTRITNGVGSLSAIVTNVLFRKISIDAKSNKIGNLLIGTSLFSLFGIVVLLSSLFFSKELVRIILGDEYQQYASLLSFLLIPVVIKWISSCLGIYVFSIGYVNYRVKVQIIAVIMFFLTFAFLNWFTSSLVILPISMAVSYSVVFLFYLLLVLRKVNEN